MQQKVKRVFPTGYPYISKGFILKYDAQRINYKLYRLVRLKINKIKTTYLSSLNHIHWVKKAPYLLKN
jgi:hypothetical protein